MERSASFLLASLLLGGASVAAQDPVADATWHPSVERPRFAAGSGPLVLVDEAHHNVHSLVGFYGPFGALLEADGYRVARLGERSSSRALAEADVVVISNALPAPTAEEADRMGSAFSEVEVAALLEWLGSGGALLLFVDHRPFPRAAAELGRALGLELDDGYALDYEVWDPIVFRRSDGTLADHPVTSGVDSVATFFGHAMRAVGPGWEPLLTFGPGIESMHPEALWEIGDDTPYVPVEGWLQGAARRLGEGRVVVLGEAGMAVAQRLGPDGPARGMNAPVASGNARFLLNVLRWLTPSAAGALGSSWAAHRGDHS